MKYAIVGPVLKDTIIIGDKSYNQTGGLTFYTGNAMHSLGCDVTVFGVYCRDDDAMIKKSFAGMKFIPIYKKGTTEHILVYGDKDPDKREIRIKSFDNTLKPSEIVDKLQEFDWIMLAPTYYPDIPEEVFRQLSNKNLVCWNFGLFSYPQGNVRVHKNPDKAREIIKYLKVFACDDNEIMIAAEKPDYRKAGIEINKICPTVIVTRGSKGSSIFSGGKETLIPAYPAKHVVDPTGAGDTFVGGFMKGMELFNDTEKAGKFAAMCSTLSIQEKGPLKHSSQDVLSALGWKK